MLTATVYDDDGDVYAGPGTDTEVRFYFVSAVRTIRMAA